MEINAKELIENGVEVDMPVEWDLKRQLCIKYDHKIKRFVLADIKTGELHYSYDRLSDLVRTTNQMYGEKYGTNDIAIEEE